MDDRDIEKEIVEMDSPQLPGSSSRVGRLVIVTASASAVDRRAFEEAGTLVVKVFDGRILRGMN
jgi:hypothetical protein